MFRHDIVSTGGAINATTGAMTSNNRRLLGFTLHASAAPTTSESFTVTLDSASGAEYNAVLYSLDLAADATTDIGYTAFNLPLAEGDAVKVAYTNTDANTFGVHLYLD